MHNPMRRREFLKVAGAAAAVAVSGNTAAQPLPVPATSPVARLFPGCCAYSYRKYLDAGTMTMEEFILKGVELGVHAVDVTAYWLKSTEPAYLINLRRLAFKNGLVFSGAAIRTQMCQADSAERARQLESIKKWIEATDLLGASHLRVFGGALPPGASERQGIEWAAETMKAACEHGAKRGITLGIEDHHGITARADQVLEILRRVDSPFAGINLDVENFEVQSEEDRYAAIEACLPHATHVHIRDIVSETRRPIDLDRIGRLFVKAGYKGYISAEYEGEEDPMTGVPKLVGKIKDLCRKYSSA